MGTSVRSEAVREALASARVAREIRVRIGRRTVAFQAPFASPADWRDRWIYFLLLDRFNNPTRPPNHPPFDGEHGVFQGGTFDGVRQELGYLAELGVGAIWLSPVLSNCAFEGTTYHGYGFQDLLRVEPRFASDPEAARRDPSIADAELRRLVDEAHARGIHVIFDVVLNHAGNVFDYDGFGATAPQQDDLYSIHWRDAAGVPAFPDFTSAPPTLDEDAAVWPAELQHNEIFRRRGKGGETGGDFESLKELVTELREPTEFGEIFPVRNVLIRAYQHLIAKFDVDGFRIDTLKFVSPEFARIFGNAMREFALSIGKTNFFTFGEVFDSEEKIARFIGRNASDVEERIGVDAALDFPLFFALPGVLKGFAAPTRLDGIFERRKEVQRGLLTSHGEASSHFVTFLDNHDMHERFYFRDPGDPDRFDDQLTMALACLFALQGIPCLYYGTEQGLHGRGSRDLAVREALWGKPGPLDLDHPFCKAIQRLSELRTAEPALRFGRQYFRPISGNGFDFGISPFPRGVVSFSRILNDDEIVFVANTNPDESFRGEMVVDAMLNREGAGYEVLFSNREKPVLPGPVLTRARDTIAIHEPGGGVTRGPARTLPVEVKPLEAQVLKQAP